MLNQIGYETLQKGLNALLNSAKEQSDDQLCESLVNFLDHQMKPHCGGIDREYAAQAFRRHISTNGRATISDCVMEWAEECASGIRWPVAYIYMATGNIGIRENTSALLVAEDRDGNILDHRVIDWCDYAQIEDDEESYTAFNKALMDSATSLGARSIFNFDCRGKLTHSVSVAYYSEQDYSYFNERSYQERDDE